MAWINSRLKSSQQLPPVKSSLVADLPVVNKLLSVDNYRNALKAYTPRLKGIAINPSAPQEGIDKRNAFTKTVIADFYPFIDDAIKNKTDYNDNILVDLLIWLFNAGDVVKGIDLALLLIEQDKQMPENFSVNLPTFVCDQIYDWANKLLEKEESATPYIDTVAEKIAVLDMPLVVYSKTLAMAAKHKLLDNTPESLKAGVGYCEKAMQINPEKHGVKTLLGKLQEALKKLS